VPGSAGVSDAVGATASVARSSGHLPGRGRPGAVAPTINTFAALRGRVGRAPGPKNFVHFTAEQLD